MYEFEPHDLHGLVLDTIRWRDEHPGPRPSLADTFNHLLAGLEVRYPNTIQWPSQWLFDESSGFLQVVGILYVSMHEFLLITGTPVPSSGNNGPFRGDLYDFVIDGEILSYRADQFEPEPTRAGGVDHLPPGEVKGAAITDHYWSLEYARGPIMTMWSSTLVGAMFTSLTFRDLARMVEVSFADVGRNLLRPGPPPCRTDEHWHNWAGNRSCDPARYYRPRTLGDIVDIVDDASAAGARIRVVGGGYSWSDLVPTSEWLVDMTRVRRLLEVDADASPPTVTVEAGMPIGELTALTARHGMVIKSPTVITLVTVGGMIGTGAHGGGMHARSFPDWVREFTIVRADGEVVTISRDDPDHADDIRAAEVSLGTLGIFYSVKIECERAFDVLSIDSHVPVDRAIEEIPDRVAACDFLEYFWFPTTDRMWVKETTRSPDRRTVPWWRRRFWALEDLWREKVFGPPMLRFVARWAPRLTPWSMRLALRMTPPRRAVESANYALHYERYYPRCYDMEVAVPLADAPAAWRLIVDGIRSEAADGRYPVNLIAHSRFLNGSASWLSPTRGRDTCYIEVLNVSDTRDWRPFFERLERQLRDRFGALPHWGKVYFQVGDLRDAYGADMTRFLEIRERWDPQRMFLNRFLEHDVFQLSTG